MQKRILILSGKGGVGKSTLTVLLAEAFVRLGKRVLCIDADVGFRSLDLLMGIGTQSVYNWADVLCEACESEEAVIYKKDGLGLLSAPGRLEEIPEKEEFDGMLKGFDEKFDCILIDAPAGWSEFHDLLAQVSDTALLVATPDAVSVRSADTAMANALRANRELETKMVINRFKKSEVLAGRQLKLDDVIDSTHTQLVGVIPENDTVRLLASGGIIADTAQKAFLRTARRLGGEYILFSKRYFS